MRIDLTLPGFGKSDKERGKAEPPYPKGLEDAPGDDTGEVKLDAADRKLLHDALSSDKPVPKDVAMKLMKSTATGGRQQSRGNSFLASRLNAALMSKR
jgi:hypothetical protein